MMSRPNLSGRLARWSLWLQDFDFYIPSSGVLLEVLPDFAIIGGLDLRTLPLYFFFFLDREHLC